MHNTNQILKPQMDFLPMFGPQDSPVRILALQTVAVKTRKGLKARNQASGIRFSSWLGYIDRRSWFLKTPQTSLNEGWKQSSVILPKSGIMLNGNVYASNRLDMRTRERIYVIAYSNEVRRHISIPVINEFCFENGKKALIKREQLFYKPHGMDGLLFWRKIDSLLRPLDAGISDKLASVEIAAYGDAVCPELAQLMFEMIKLSIK